MLDELVQGGFGINYRFYDGWFSKF